MTDDAMMDDLMWLQLDLAILKRAGDDMIEGIPLGQQITDEHIRAGIRDWFSDVTDDLEIEVVDAMLIRYKDYTAQRKAMETLCMNIMEGLLGRSIISNLFR